MKVKRILKNSQYFFTALAISVWVNSALHHKSSSIYHSVAFAQSGNNCPSIEAPSFEPLIASANSDANVQDLMSSCIETAYESYSSSLDINFVQPLAQIANEDPDSRSESFVNDTAGLDIKQMIEDLEYLQALVKSALDSNAVQASALIAKLNTVQDELSSTEDVIITPLLSNGQNIDRLNQIFVYEDGEGKPEIENIQKNIPSVDIPSGSQGDYGPETFVGIKQFLENRNAAIENSLQGERIPKSEAIDESEAIDGVPSLSPGLFGNPLWIGVIVLGLVLLALRVIIKRQNASSQPTGGTNARGDRSTSQNRDQREPLITPPRTSGPHEPENNTAVLSIPDALATPQSNYSPPQPKPDNRSNAPEESTKVKHSDAPDGLSYSEVAEPKPTPSYQRLLETKETNIRPVRNKKRKTRLIFSFSESELVNEYNRNFRGLEPGAHAVEQTTKSATKFHHGYNNRIELEAKPTGKYWRIHIEKRNTHYLVPVKDGRFNVFDMDALGACFYLQNKGASREFELVKPAVIKCVKEKSIWRLVEKGEIRFLEQKTNA